MTRAGWVLVVAFAAFGAGCAGARSSRASRTAPPPAESQAQAQTDARESGGASGMGSQGMHEGMTMQCPMAVPGTQVAAEDTPEGEAITFTTTSPDAVPDLRARVHAMADRYERRHASGQAGTMPEGDSSGDESGAGSAGSGSADADQMPTPAPAPSRAVVEDVEGGARVTVTPNDPADLEHLRSSIRERVAYMQDTGSCGMRHEHGAQGQQQDEQPRAPQR